jgi:hypothetical protein
MPRHPNAFKTCGARCITGQQTAENSKMEMVGILAYGKLKTAVYSRFLRTQFVVMVSHMAKSWARLSKEKVPALDAQGYSGLA